MRGLKNIKLKWHILLMIAAVLVLSLGAWINFAQKTGSVLWGWLTGTAEIVEEEADPPENLIQPAIRMVDSEWTVWQEPELSKIDQTLTYFGTGELSSTQVIAGKEKWLFYRGVGDGDPIGDFEGTHTYSGQEMEEMAEAVRYVQENAESRGIRYALMVAPSKENVYPEYMPDNYTHAEKSGTDRLMEYLREKGINAVSPKAELLALHESFQLYYYYDTHWNQLGGYVGVREVLRSWGLDMPELKARKIVSKPLKDNYHFCAKDDLAFLADLRSVLSDEPEYEIEGTASMDWATFEAEQNNYETSHFTNESAVNQATVLVVGDSFRAAMVPALREQFRDVYVVARDAYAPWLLDDCQPDYLLAEYVERYSSEIVNIY